MGRRGGCNRRNHDMSHARAECVNCGAQSTVPCEAITVIVDIVVGEPSICWTCQLCGHNHDELRVADQIAVLLLEGGAVLAAPLHG